MSSFELFPILNDRKHQLAGTLSGGEQQMLAIARVLFGKTALILLDEPTEGLAPLIVKELKETIQEIKGEDVALLLERDPGRVTHAELIGNQRGSPFELFFFRTATLSYASNSVYYSS